MINPNWRDYMSSVQLVTADGEVLGSVDPVNVEIELEESDTEVSSATWNIPREASFTMSSFYVHYPMLSTMTHGTKNWRTQEIERLNKIWQRTKKRRIKDILYKRMGKVYWERMWEVSL